jgi:hypothetical protein
MKKIVFLILSGLFLLISVTHLTAYENVNISASITPSVLVPGEEGLITVIFDIQEGFHQTRADDFFFITFENNEWFSMGEIIYPVGVLKDGLENYYGKVTLE